MITLQELAKNSRWVEMEKIPGKGGKIKDDEISFFVKKRKKKESYITDKVCIRFGCNVIDLLQWKAKDKVLIFHHPDDFLSLMIVKSTSVKGYTLQKETNCNIHKIEFTWINPVVLQEREAEKVAFMHIQKNNSIVFRVDN